MEDRVIVPASKLREELATKLAERKAKNWQCTLESIERNAAAANRLAWSDLLLEPEEIKKLEEAGYTVTLSAENDCHKISW